jgi:hypothetical protein
MRQRGCPDGSWGAAGGGWRGLDSGNARCGPGTLEKKRSWHGYCVCSL